MRGYKFVITTIILVLVTVFCTAGTVIGQDKDSVRVDEKYYREMEREYVKQVRYYLNDNGYENSGVALTKVLEADGSREYTLNVHHKRIDRLSKAEQKELEEALQTLAGTLNEFGEIWSGNIWIVF